MSFLQLQERKRNLLVLVNSFLVESGYIEAAGTFALYRHKNGSVLSFCLSISERLQHEAGGAINKFSVADNIDLGLIVSEYETYVSILSIKFESD